MLSRLWIALSTIWAVLFFSVLAVFSSPTDQFSGLDVIVSLVVGIGPLLAGLLVLRITRWVIFGGATGQAEQQ